MTIRYARLATAFLFFFAPVWCLAQTTENCTNGLDDDGDGLIDCYDTDCTCTGQCDDFYYTTCNADCFYVPPCNQITLGVQWAATVETNTYSPLIAGDMDGDGVPEVVTYRCENTEIYILDGATGAVKVAIISPTTLPGGTAPAMADLDLDGLGEFVIVGQDRILRCYNHDGSLLYASTVQVGYDDRYRFSCPNIADFDHNGTPEVNIGNQVFNGQTGALLASGGLPLSAGEHPARRQTGFSFNMPVAIDALPDSFCPDCDGLEIVAGNQVLSVNLVTGAVNVVVSAPSNYSDGFTSVVDFDRDGDLDAIVQGRKNNQNWVYCWEIETPTVMREYRLVNNWFEGASRVNVADLNGDGSLEISFMGHPRLYALRNDFTPMWINIISDPSSVTCSSVFDFCGDGSADIVYRGSTALQVIEGATGLIKWQDNCLSATHIENPLILDVDADGQTEIVIQCGSTSPDFGVVTCYEAINLPGISSRKVWNQHAYHNTNINDDLSVPRIQQNHHIIGDSLRMNTFLNQFFNPTFPSPDGDITIQSVDCQGDTMAVNVEICNSGDNVLPANTPVSFYRGNPFTSAATWSAEAPIGVPVVLNQCVQVTLRVPRTAVVNDSIYLMLNDDHTIATPFTLAQFPSTTIGECRFNNNFTKFYYRYTPAQINLGADTIICDNATVALNAAGTDLSTWVWSTGATSNAITATDAGIFAVTVTDVCDIGQTDSIQISIDSSTVVTIGPDQFICRGETVALGESGFDYYIWRPTSQVSCGSCPNVTLTPAFTTTVTLEAGFSNGCFSRDTALITVYDTFYVKIDTTVCFGRSVTWNGFTLAPGQGQTVRFQTVNGCDSTVQVQVIGTTIGTYNFTVDTAVCVNRTINYGGFVLAPGDEQLYNLSAITGCDSTVLLRVVPLDTFATAEAITICTGESYAIFGQNQNTSGVYQRTFAANNGCDSTHTVALTVQPPIALAVVPTPTCANEATGTLTANPGGGVPPYAYAWSAPNADNQPDVPMLPAGSYTLTLTDANDCTQTATATITAYPAQDYALTVDSVRCFGQSNGQIVVSSPDPTLLFSLDGQAFIGASTYGRLPAGDYVVQTLDPFGCSDTLDVAIGEPAALLLSLPPDTTLRLGDSMQLFIQTTAVGDVMFDWVNPAYLSDSSSLITQTRPQTSIRYALTITDTRGCTASDVMDLIVERIRQVYVPNAFSDAADDDINRQLIPGFGASVQTVRRFAVFDRWGDLVHEARQVPPGAAQLRWDGRIRGQKAPAATYVWMMEVVLIDGTTEWYKGDVTFIR
jgi:CHU_C Type IX secretion signal domain/SprB repeat